MDNQETLRNLFAAGNNFNKSSDFSFQSCQSKTFKGRATLSIKRSDLISNNNVGACREYNFSIGDPDFCKVKLRIFPHGESENTRNLVIFHLLFKSQLPESSWYRCTLSFLDGNGVVIPDKSVTLTDSGKDVVMINFNDLTDACRIENFYIDGKLFMECYLEIYFHSTFSQSDVCEYSVHGCKIIPVPTQINIDRIIPDFYLEIESEKIGVNRGLLMCEIPLLRALFRFMPTEATEHKLQSVKASAFKDILKYVYTKEIKFSSFKHACEIFNSASFLKMSNLRDICVTYISGNLNPRNAILISNIIGDNIEDMRLRKAVDDLRTIPVNLLW